MGQSNVRYLYLPFNEQLRLIAPGRKQFVPYWLVAVRFQPLFAR